MAPFSIFFQVASLNLKYWKRVEVFYSNLVVRRIIMRMKVEAPVSERIQDPPKHFIPFN
jgi:hypothetical protein